MPDYPISFRLCPYFIVYIRLSILYIYMSFDLSILRNIGNNLKTLGKYLKKILGDGLKIIFMNLINIGI